MSNGREHLRELLVTHGVLPERDRYLAAYERWAKDSRGQRHRARRPPAHHRLLALASRPPDGSLRGGR